jgi:hypothetical protein
LSYGYEITAGTSYGYGLPALIGGVWAYVVTAPEPQLSIDGHAGTITSVRYAWAGLRCSACRQPLHLSTDDGAVEAGLKVTNTGGREPTLTADWYETYRPATTPELPTVCPHPECRSHTTKSHRPRVCLEDGWTLSADPVDIGHTRTTPAQPTPAHPHVYRLLGQVWDTMRATYPDLAALADTRAAEQIRRAAARRASRSRGRSR